MLNRSTLSHHHQHAQESGVIGGLYSHFTGNGSRTRIVGFLVRGFFKSAACTLIFLALAPLSSVAGMAAANDNYAWLADFADRSLSAPLDVLGLQVLSHLHSFLAQSIIFGIGFGLGFTLLSVVRSFDDRS